MKGIINNLKETKLAHFFIRRAKERILLYRFYPFSIFSKNRKQLLVAVFDEKRRAMGLADRLKGLVSLFAFSKVKNIPFRLLFTYPFDISLFFQPNEYDWQLKENELITYTADTKIFILQGESADRLLKLNSRKQVHAYLNRDYLAEINQQFKTDFEWGKLFNELFKPTKRLNEEIDNHLEIIGSPYTACQLRFMALLGDFNELNSPTLAEKERNALIQQCAEKILYLQEKDKKPILVASDSISFSNHIGTFEGIFTFPDKIIHIANSDNQHENVYMKPFIYFFLLSKADKVYSIVADKMYPSEFPLYASKINNKPFERINI